MTGRIVVLASGEGTNTQAVLDACSDVLAGPSLDAVVVGVFSDRADARVLERAAASGVPSFALVARPHEPRSQYDSRLRESVVSMSPDLIVLAGWMRILSMSFLGGLAVPVVNLHPALPGDLPGVRAIERAFDERSVGRTTSGVMVHLVPDEGVDVGPVLASEAVPILDDDTLSSFAARMHEVERRLLVATLRGMLDRTPPSGGVR